VGYKKSDASEDVHAHWKVIETGSYQTEISPQGHDNIPGVNARTAGTTQIAANLVVMGPGVKAKGHIHHHHETIIFLLDGFAVTFMGPNQEPVIQRPGDFLFIPQGVEHLPANLSSTKPAIGLVCRSDPKFYESLELLPHIDEIVATLLPPLQAKHEAGELPADWKKHYKGSFNLANVKQVFAPTTESS
jgi:uncharacterized RmlC-like cupin family protein